MKTALIQMNMKAGDTVYNYEHACCLLEKAATEKPDVIILPETWNTGFFPKEELFEKSDRNAEKTRELLGSISRKYGVNIVGGSVTEEKNGNIYNTCYVFDRRGEEIASYSKIHLFSPMDENKYYTPGSVIGTFFVDGIKAGVMICYDLRFPEVARKLALEGVRVIFVPAQWPGQRINQMRILASARAVENQLHLVLCNSSGVYGDTVFGGNSLVCDPLGNVTELKGNSEEILYYDIDDRVTSELRNSFNVFNDRIESLY